MGKCIIIDLDETVGYFNQLYKITCRFQTEYNVEFTPHQIIQIFKKFKNIFRGGIYVLFAYINIIKQSHSIRVLLYTNTLMIFHQKLEEKAVSSFNSENNNLLF